MPAKYLGKAEAEYKRVKEQEANYFALHLLMPEMNLRQELAKLGTFDLLGEGPRFDMVIKKLAKLFAVPTNAVKIRLTILYFEGN